MNISTGKKSLPISFKSSFVFLHMWGLPGSLSSTCIQTPISLLTKSDLVSSWSQAGHFGLPAHPTCPPPAFVCGKIWPKNKFNQRSENMKKQRKAFQWDQIIRVSKQNQGPLVPFRELWITFRAMFCELSWRDWNSRQVERLSAWWPGCSCHINCHSSEDWP